MDLLVIKTKLFRTRFALTSEMFATALLKAGATLKETKLVINLLETVKLAVEARQVEDKIKKLTEDINEAEN